MNESNVSTVLFVIITSVVSFGCHLLIRSYKRSVIVSAILSAILFQMVGYLYIGYLDPFFLIALVITGIIAGLVSAVIGLSFKKIRNGKL